MPPPAARTLPTRCTGGPPRLVWAAPLGGGGLPMRSVVGGRLMMAGGLALVAAGLALTGDGFRRLAGAAAKGWTQGYFVATAAGTGAALILAGMWLTRLRRPGEPAGPT